MARCSLFEQGEAELLPALHKGFSAPDGEIPYPLDELNSLGHLDGTP
jgi:hypothetical protein